MHILPKAKKLSWVLAALVCGCGGGDAGTTQDVPVSAVPSSAAAAMAGDWTIPSGQAHAVSARSAAEWQALWVDRLAQINCNQPFNQVACAATAAPAIDFSSHDLIGIALASHCAFGSPEPERVFLDFGVGKLVVELTYACVFKVPLLPESTKTLFFLVPKSTVPVELRANEA